MGVAEPLRRPTASRGRKRPRAAARLVGTSRAACCRPRLRVNPFLVWFVFLWLLFSGVWETLIFGTGDWFAFGEPFFCGLFTPTYPLPGHRLVPESHIFIVSPGECASDVGRDGCPFRDSPQTHKLYIMAPGVFDKQSIHQLVLHAPHLLVPNIWGQVPREKSAVEMPAAGCNF